MCRAGTDTCLSMYMEFVFWHVLGEQHFELRYMTTESGMLKLFAFVTCLIRIFGCGLQTFKLARYRQLNKRIGRLIRLARDLVFYLHFCHIVRIQCQKQTWDIMNERCARVWNVVYRFFWKRAMEVSDCWWYHSVAHWTGTYTVVRMMHRVKGIGTPVEKIYNQ